MKIIIYPGAKPAISWHGIQITEKLFMHAAIVCLSSLYSSAGMNEAV